MPGPDQKKIEALDKKMAGLGIQKQDIHEKFVKSSGRGGQKVNKTSSAVFMSHGPTGLSVKVGKSRSQHLNRFLALRSLVEKIEALQTGKKGSRADQKIARLKKQKQRRKRKAAKKHGSGGSAKSTN